MDETPRYVDMPADTTIASIGEKSIGICSSGKDKHRISCFLTISASGSMTKAFIIMKGLVKPPKVNLPENLYLAASKSGFLDGYLMMQYLKAII